LNPKVNKTFRTNNNNTNNNNNDSTYVKHNKTFTSGARRVVKHHAKANRHNHLNPKVNKNQHVNSKTFRFITNKEEEMLKQERDLYPIYQKVVEKRAETYKTILLTIAENRLRLAEQDLSVASHLYHQQLKTDKPIDITGINQIHEFLERCKDGTQDINGRLGALQLFFANIQKIINKRRHNVFNDIKSHIANPDLYLNDSKLIHYANNLKQEVEIHEKNKDKIKDEINNIKQLITDNQKQKEMEIQKQKYSSIAPEQMKTDLTKSNIDQSSDGLILSPKNDNINTNINNDKNIDNITNKTDQLNGILIDKELGLNKINEEIESIRQKFLRMIAKMRRMSTIDTASMIPPVITTHMTLSEFNKIIEAKLPTNSSPTITSWQNYITTMYTLRQALGITLKLDHNTTEYIDKNINAILDFHYKQNNLKKICFTLALYCLNHPLLHKYIEQLKYKNKKIYCIFFEERQALIQYTKLMTLTFTVDLLHDISPLLLTNDIKIPETITNAIKTSTKKYATTNYYRLLDYKPNTRIKHKTCKVIKTDDNFILDDFSEPTDEIINIDNQINETSQIIENVEMDKITEAFKTVKTEEQLLRSNIEDHKNNQEKTKSDKGLKEDSSNNIDNTSRSLEQSESSGNQVSESQSFNSE
jgi:hypothetical protein